MAMEITDQEEIARGRSELRRSNVQSLAFTTISEGENSQLPQIDRIQEEELLQIKSNTESSDAKQIDLSSSNRKAIPIPSGWNRILEKGAITYISPNKSRLRSMEDIKLYMVSPGTCKCGLMCPLITEETFSFNPLVPSIPMLKRKSNSCASCEVSKSFERLLPCLTPEEVARLLKRSSKKKKKKTKNDLDKGTKRKNNQRKPEQRSHTFVTPMDAEEQVSLRQRFTSGLASDKLENIETISGSKVSSNQNFDPIIAYSQIEGIPEVNADKKARFDDSADYVGYSSITKLDSKSSLKRSSSGSQLNADVITEENEFLQTSDSAKKSLSIIRPAASASTKSKSMIKNAAKKSKKASLTGTDLGLEASRQMAAQKNLQEREPSSVSSKNISKSLVNASSVLHGKPAGHRKSSHSHGETRKSSMNPQKCKITSPAESQISSNSLNPSLNLLTNKAPPNITLPLSHSVALPPALTQNISSSNENLRNLHPEEFYTSISPGSSNSGASPIELEQSKKSEPDAFSHVKAKANVYWGSTLQTSAQESIRKSSESITGTVASCKLTVNNALNAETNHPHSNAKLSSASTVNAQKSTLSLQAGTGSTKRTNTNQDKHRKASKVNGIPALNARTEAKHVNTISADFSSASLPQGKQQLNNSHSIGINQRLSFDASLSPQITGDTSSIHPDFMSSSNKSLISSTSNEASVQPIPVVPISEHNDSAVLQQAPKSKSTPDKDNILTQESNMQSPNAQAGASQGALAPSAVAVGPPVTASQGTQMVLFQFVSQNNNVKSTIQTAGSTTPTSVDQARATSVPSFHNVYGSGNTTSIVRQPSSAYQSNMSATNPAQFLIMGSQASQALQHLALQNSALQATMQHTDTSHAMYSTSALKAANPNVGFAYTNVPLQFLPIGGGQVIGKQPQNHPASVDQFHSVYQYYQSGRAPETGKFDSTQQAVNQAATYLYPGLNQFTPAIPNNYVRIAPANTIARPTVPGIAIPKFPIAPEAPKVDPMFSSPNYTQKVNVDSNALRDKVNNTSPLKQSEKAKKTESKRVAKVNEPLKQETFEKTNIKQNSFQDEANKKALACDNISAENMNQSIAQTISTTRDIPALTVNKCSIENSLEIYQNCNTRSAYEGANTAEMKPCISIEGSSKIFNPESGREALADSEITQHDSQIDKSEIEKDATQAICAKKRELDDQEELSLECHEDAASVDSRTPTPENSGALNLERPIDFRIIQTPINFTLRNSNILGVGDLIWGHQKGYSAWPGKIVSESEIGESRANEGYVWVKWFGEHTHSQIELSKLKVLSEGLKDLESNTRRRKSRGSKKVSESLEKAICEALLEVDKSAKDYHIYQKYLDNSSDFHAQSNDKIVR